MPVYLFRCEPCNIQFEINLSITEDDPKCHKCSGLVMKVINFQGRINGNCASRNH